MSNAAQEIVTREEAAPPAQIVNQGDALLSMIERAARDQSVDIEKFERLMALRERMTAAQARRDFDEAIAAAKGEIGPIVKNRTVDFTSQKGRTNYKHEDFAGIAQIVDPILSKHGIAYRFRSRQEGGKLTVTCILSKGGYFEETELSAGEDHSGNKNSHQAIGSAATYLQRYTLKLALGLASAHDDDGRAAGSGAGETVSPEQAEKIRAALKFADADEAKFLEYIKVDTVEDILAAKFDQVMALIAQRKAAADKARAK